MTDFKPGELVDIVIRGARVTQALPGQLAVSYGQTGSLVSVVNVATTAPGVEVVRIAPAEWPPQAGDLWRDGKGTLHFGVEYGPDYDDKADSEGIAKDGTRVILVASGGDYSCRLSAEWYRPEQVNQRSGPLTLLHREQPAKPGE